MSGTGADKQAHWILALYGLYLALPIYWLLRLALQSNQAILSGEADWTLANYCLPWAQQTRAHPPQAKRRHLG